MVHSKMERQGREVLLSKLAVMRSPQLPGRVRFLRLPLTAARTVNPLAVHL